MGSSFSSSSGVLIWCHKPFYFGGETVEGYVCLNLSTGLGASTVNVEVRQGLARCCAVGVATTIHATP